MQQYRIGETLVGQGSPCYVVAEIGINHNGDLAIARQLIDVAVRAGCNAVKFQKRSPELCVPRAEWNRQRDTPWGTMSYLEYKRRIELGEAEYRAIDAHCRERGIRWFASCWDPPSLDFMRRFDLPCYKIASACLTDRALLERHRSAQVPIILSTGMSTLEQIDAAVKTLASADLILLHTTSAYPCRVEDLNLRVMDTLRQRYQLPTGYSGHETGLAPTVAAVALGACLVERHITLDRAMWGTDQAASVEPPGLARLVRDIRAIESALGDGVKRVAESEAAVMRNLRRVA